jgi:hypothetical protein
MTGVSFMSDQRQLLVQTRRFNPMAYKFADEAQTIVATPLGNVPLARFQVEHAEDEGGVPAIEPYTPPPAPGATVPESVTPYQAREALRGAGLLATVNAHIEAEGAESPAYNAWHYASRIRRASPFVESIGPALGLSEEAIDGLFIAAAGLDSL